MAPKGYYSQTFIAEKLELPGKQIAVLGLGDTDRYETTEQLIKATVKIQTIHDKDVQVDVLTAQ